MQDQGSITLVELIAAILIVGILAAVSIPLMKGPWGKRSNIMWMYNYSTKCPKDLQGKTCTDILVDEFSQNFLPGGQLEIFDGVEFDVLYHQRGDLPTSKRTRGPDMDADGKADYGFFDGITAGMEDELL